MTAQPVTASTAEAFGTEDDPLVHPVTGERIVFGERAWDTGGEHLELDAYRRLAAQRARHVGHEVNST